MKGQVSYQSTVTLSTPKNTSITGKKVAASGRLDVRKDFFRCRQVNIPNVVSIRLATHQIRSRGLRPGRHKNTNVLLSYIDISNRVDILFAKPTFPSCM